MIFHIVGTGPCGLSLAWILGKQGHIVHMYEKADQVGGVWRSNQPDKKDTRSFSQCTPQIMTGVNVNTYGLFREMGLDLDDYFTKTQSTRWAKLMVQSFSVTDYLFTAIALGRYMITPGWSKLTTINDHFRHTMSADGLAFFDRIGRVVDGVGKQTLTVHEMFGVLDQIIIPQGSETSVQSARSSPEGFAGAWKGALEHMMGPERLFFHFNSGLENVTINHEKVTRCTFSNGDNLTVKNQDHLILAIDPLGFTSLLDKSHPSLERNWPVGTRDKLTGGMYISMPITIRFEKPLSDEAVSSLINTGSTEWAFICLVTGFDRHLLTCSALDPSLTSSRLGGKTLAECDPITFQDEAVWQITKALVKHKGHGDSNHVVASYIDESAQWDSDKQAWTHSLSSGAPTVLGPIHPTGTLDNIGYVNSLNKVPMPNTTIESAVQAAILFSNRFQTKQNMRKLKSPLRLSVLLAMTLLVFLMIIFLYTVYFL
jgi:hypothetical protein